MDSYKDRVKALDKEKKAVQLTAIQWEPKAGEQLVGELIMREVIEKKANGQHYDKVTLRTDTGVYDTIIKAGILALADPPVKKGDLFVITYNGLKQLDKDRSMHDTTVTVYPMDDGAPF